MPDWVCRGGFWVAAFSRQEPWKRLLCRTARKGLHLFSGGVQTYFLQNKGRLILELELTIEKIVYGGKGLARHQGRVVFVPFAAPGEKILAEVVKEQKDFLEARILRILSPAPCRVVPKCRWFGECGGCQLQHLEYAAQLESKKGFIREAFSRIAKTVQIPEIKMIPSSPWEYRNRVQWKYEKKSGHTILGFFAGESNRLIPVDACPLAHPLLNQERGQFCIAADSDSAIRGETEAAVDGNDRLEILCNGKAVAGKGLLETEIAEKKISWSASVFFQCNRFLLDDFVRCVTGARSGTRALDLYAGAGLFSAFLSESFERVEAVEENPFCLPFFRKNISSSKTTLCSQKVETWLLSQAKAWKGADCVVVDPPRAGLSPEVRDGVKKLCPKKLVYVSCNPSTLARDTAFFMEKGYALERLTAFDFFPQTFHVESVAVLDRISP